MNERYEEGTKIRITLEAVVDSWESDRFLGHKDQFMVISVSHVTGVSVGEDGLIAINMWTVSPLIKVIEHPLPSNWPPLAGDLWEAGDRRFLFQSDPGADGDLFVSDDQGEQWRIEDFDRPRGMSLISRRGA